MDEDHDISIWTDTDVLLVSDTVDQYNWDDSTVAPNGYWRWVQLTNPLYLNPGTYRIAAYMPSSMDDVAYEYGVPMSVTMGPGVAFDRMGWIEEDGVWRSRNLYGYFGPNFRYDPVPEPSVIQLPVLLAASGLAWRWRRTRKA